MHECVKRLPDKKFIYFADNYNVPYGNYICEQLLKKVDAIFSQIAEFNPSAAVIACNTVTAQCAAYLREKYSFPIIGIQPAIKPAAASARRCVVLATPATAASSSVKELVERFGRGVTEVIACRELASYIESNIFNLSEQSIFEMLPEVDTDTVVLGCTHYVYIKDYVKAKYCCPIFDGLEGTAKHLCNILGDVENNQKILNADVKFIGGDEEKNEKVFKSLFFPKKAGSEK